MKPIAVDGLLNQIAASIYDRRFGYLAITGTLTDCEATGHCPRPETVLQCAGSRPIAVGCCLWRCQAVLSSIAACPSSRVIRASASRFLKPMRSLSPPASRTRLACLAVLIADSAWRAM